MTDLEIRNSGKEGAKKGKPPRLVWTVLAAVLLFVAAVVVYIFDLGLVRQPPRDSDVLELALYPTTKVTLHLQQEWTAKKIGGDQAVELTSLAPPNGKAAGATLFFTAGEPESIKQEDMDKLMQFAYADLAKSTLEKQLNVVEVKSASGTGAYAVLSIDMDMFGHGPVYTKYASGLFLTHGVLVKFGMVEASQLPQVLKFIEEGITVSSINFYKGQTLELEVAPKEKLRLQAAPGWIIYALPLMAECWQVMMESPAGMKMTLFAGANDTVKTSPPSAGAEDMVSNWVKTLPEGKRPPVVELKMRSGQGAYAVTTGSSAGGMETKVLCGAFGMGNVIGTFSSDNIGDQKSPDFEHALEFIEERITVE